MGLISIEIKQKSKKLIMEKLPTDRKLTLCSITKEWVNIINILRTTKKIPN